MGEGLAGRLHGRRRSRYHHDHGARSQGSARGRLRGALSLIPFATKWVGDHDDAAVPTAVYGVALLMPALAWLLPHRCIIRSQGAESILARALGPDRKGKVSAALYGAGILLAFVLPVIADPIDALVALLWLVPDRRDEAAMQRGPAEPTQNT